MEWVMSVWGLLYIGSAILTAIIAIAIEHRDEKNDRCKANHPSNYRS